MYTKVTNFFKHLKADVFPRNYARRIYFFSEVAKIFILFNFSKVLRSTRIFIVFQLEFDSTVQLLQHSYSHRMMSGVQSSGFIAFK